jgi:ubiquinone/menaquinone biosynthesis C-methylase UbiE
MSGGLVFDEEIAARLESIYRTRDILRRRSLVREALGASRGERILDVGCGPGFYVAELLEAVGETGSVVGIDNSPQMLAVAAQRVAGRPSAAFHEADATSLPVEDRGFDAALSVQVIEYVADADRALRELFRVLRPDGRAVVWDVDWSTISWHSTDAERMDRALRAWDAHLAHPALPRTLAARLRAVGFADVAAQGHVFATTDSSTMPTSARSSRSWSSSSPKAAGPTRRQPGQTTSGR